MLRDLPVDSPGHPVTNEAGSRGHQETTLMRRRKGVHRYNCSGTVHFLFLSCGNVSNAIGINSSAKAKDREPLRDRDERSILR